MTTDVWAGVVSAAEPHDHALDASVEARFPDTLVARAKKRHVFYAGNFAWSIMGDEKLGDTYEDYSVVFNTASGKYQCMCYTTAHGQSRSRRVCSHVLAVILWRKEPKNRGLMKKTDANTSVGIEAEEHESLEEADARAPFGSRAPQENFIPLPPASALPVTFLPTLPDLTPPGWDAPPEWLTAYRPQQQQAVAEVLELLESNQLVWLDAPTGAGKTAIGDAVSRLRRQRSLYVCSSKQLQDQFLGDYPYARVLKGKSNYPTMTGGPEITGEDCNGTPGDNDCTWCDPMNRCPYRVAKQAAIQGQVAVLNTAYWLREANSQRPAFSRAPSAEDARGGLVVIDECDTLENAVMGYLDYGISNRMMRQLKVEVPKKGSHKPTISAWMRDELVPAVKAGIAQAKGDSWGGIESERAVRRLQEFGRETVRVAAEIEDDNWIRDNNAGPFTWKPVTIAPYGMRRIWRHAGSFLGMSATIISAEQMVADLGFEGDYATVRVPMEFPVDQRPIHVAPVANMKGGEQTGRESGEWERMAVAVRRVCERHPGERVLVHTVSYALAKFLMMDARTWGRPRFTYTQAADRDTALREFRTTAGAVLFAPSMDRGVDLRDDDCRVVVVAKVPFPNLGDRQINERLHTPNGQGWYSVQTVRSLVQMTGRAVRSKDDWCETYILDAQFVRNIWKKNKNLLPEWWRQALNMKFRVKELQ